MKDKISKAIIKRYSSIPTLKLCIYEDEDTVLMNILDDLKYKTNEDKILKTIKELLK